MATNLMHPCSGENAPNSWAPDRVRRPTIVHIITDLSTGGAEMMLLKVIRGTKKHFNHSVVSLRTFGTVGPLIEREGIEVIALSMHTPAGFFTALPRLAKYLNRIRPRVIQGWMYHGNLLALFACALFTAKSAVVWNVRASISEFDEKLATRALLWVSARVSRLTTAVIYCSRTARAQHEDIGFCSRNALVVPNGFDIDRFKPDADARHESRVRFGISPDAVLAGQVARFDRYKDQRNFLVAAAIVARANPNSIFLMAGRDIPEIAKAMPDLDPLIRELGPRLILLPEILEVAKLMSAFDVFVLSSWAEGFPNVLGEAMACGVPCVTTDVGDAAEIVGRSGIVVPPQNPQELAQAIIRCLNMTGSQRLALSKSARERVIKNYSIEVVSRLYGDVWKGVMSRPRGAAELPS